MLGPSLFNGELSLVQLFGKYHADSAELVLIAAARSK